MVRDVSAHVERNVKYVNDLIILYHWHNQSSSSFTEIIAVSFMPYTFHIRR